MNETTNAARITVKPGAMRGMQVWEQRRSDDLLVLWVELQTKRPLIEVSYRTNHQQGRRTQTLMIDMHNDSENGTVEAYRAPATYARTLYARDGVKTPSTIEIEGLSDEWEVEAPTTCGYGFHIICWRRQTNPATPFYSELEESCP